MVVRHEGRAVLIGVVVSVACHGLAVMALPALDPSPARPGSAVVSVEVRGAPPGPAGGHGPAERAPTAAPGGAHSVQNVDAPVAGGRGERTGATRVILLVEHADPVTLQDSPMTATGVAETQRIRTARNRATAEPRRATPHPMDAPFLASGAGGHPERRVPAPVDPRSGALHAPPASPRGGPAATAPLRVADAPEGAEALATPDDPWALGAPIPSPGRGILDGHGERERTAARVAHARPPVDLGRAATLAAERDARVRDNRNSELLATRATESWVEASERSGPEAGAGRGGTGGGGAPGSGSMRAEGGRALGYGPGRGAFAALDTRSRRYQRWFLDVQRRVAGALVFPRERMVRMDQGTSVYRIVVRRDGTLARSPELLRSSRFDDLDAAALRAIEKSAPFGRLPAELVDDRGQLAVTIPIEFSNPMVH